MNAADVMSRKVLVVQPNAPLAQAARLMVDNQVSGLPVVDEARRPVGILTEGDLMRRVEIGTEGDRPTLLRSVFTPGSLAQDYVRTHSRRVAELMTRDVVSVDEQTSLDKIVRLMQSRRIKRVPVTRQGTVVGIVSRADLVRLLADTLDAPVGVADDAELRKRVLAEFARLPWLPHRSIAISVTDGVVGLDGVVFGARQRDAACVAAETIPGVRAVENRLVWVEPSTGIVLIDPAPDEPRKV